jgi:hypothetical protein
MKKYEVKIIDVDYGMLEGFGFNRDDDAIKIYTFHRNYEIGNKHNYTNMIECIEDNQKDNHIYSLYMYDHSGLAFSLAPFNDKWDSALFGCVCVSKELSSIEATKRACEMVKEANDIEAGAFVELIINELDICECCNNTKNREYIDGFIFNIYNKEDKEAVIRLVKSYIKYFNTNDLDEIIDNRDYRDY